MSPYSDGESNASQHKLAAERTHAHCNLRRKSHFPRTKSSTHNHSFVDPVIFPADQLAKLHDILSPFRYLSLFTENFITNELKITFFYLQPTLCLVTCSSHCFLWLLSLQCITDTLRARGINVSTSLPDDVLDFVRRHPLMSQSVQTSDKRPLMFRRTTDYTHMAVHMVQAVDGQTYHVLYMGTGEYDFTSGINCAILLLLLNHSGQISQSIVSLLLLILVKFTICSMVIRLHLLI